LAAVAIGAEAEPPPAPARDANAALPGMLLDRPPVPITLPKGTTAPPKPVPLPVDGSMVVARRGRLVAEAKADWMRLEFDAEPGKRPELPRRVLPCALLEQMEAMAANAPDLRFRVSGETTIFRKQAYLLPRNVVAEPPAPAPPAPKPAPAPAPRPSPKPPAPSTKPASPATAPAGETGKEPTASDVLKDLLKHKVGRAVPVAPPAKRAAPAPSVAPGPQRTLRATRGAMIVDRLVRILPEPGRWWAARFEADNTLGEPPLRLLPCKFLERAQDRLPARRLGPAPLHRVTGEVTQYRGRRYLLIRKLLPERNLGRF
jgi:hypothetical protein